MENSYNKAEPEFFVPIIKDGRLFNLEVTLPMRQISSCFCHFIKKDLEHKINGKRWFDNINGKLSKILNFLQVL